MVRLWAIMLFGLVGFSAQATEIEVRSGEHGAFTRLVFRIPPETRWTLEHTEETALLAIDLPNIEYRTKDVFSRIPRTRLADLEQTAPGQPLKLHMNCRCVASGFVQSGTLLVVDIKERPEGILPPPSPQVSLPLPLGSTRIPSSQIEGTGTDVPTDPELPAARVALPLVQMDQAVEHQLVSRVLRGIDQEMLTLDTRSRTPSLQTSGSAPANSAEALVQGLGLSNLRVATAIDRDLRGAGNLLTESAMPSACLDDVSLAVETWGNDSPFSAQVAELRGRLFGEFDRVDPEAVRDMARLYIHFGFGAEARNILGMSGEKDEGHALLSALADAMDGARIRGMNPLAGQQACPGSAALWSALTSGRVVETADTSAILRAFGHLPQHLRSHLGPILGAYLTDAGFVDAAHQMLRATERAGHADPMSVAMVQATLAEKEHDPEVQEKKLIEVVSDSSASDQAPLALVKLIAKRWAEGGDISENDLELAAAFALEYRNAPIGPELEAAHVVALALGNRFDAAMNEISKTSASRNTPIWAETLNKVLSRLTDRGDDVTFLRHVSGQTNEVFLAISPTNAEAIAHRLGAMGFFELGLRYADRPQDRKTRRDRAELIALMTLGSDRPHRALLELQGIDSLEGDRIRAEALSRNGAYSEAAQLLLRTGDLDTASRYAWLSGAAEPMEGTEATAFGEIHSIGRSLLLEAPVPPETPLAEAQSLVESSAETRLRIEEMLSRLD